MLQGLRLSRPIGRFWPSRSCWVSLGPEKFPKKLLGHFLKANLHFQETKILKPDMEVDSSGDVPFHVLMWFSDLNGFVFSWPRPRYPSWAVFAMVAPEPTWKQRLNRKGCRWWTRRDLGVEPKIGGKPPKWMVKIMENPIFQWMIWGYHYFPKHPFGGWRGVGLMKIQSRSHLTFGAGPQNSASFFGRVSFHPRAISGKSLMKDYSIWAGWGGIWWWAGEFRRSWDSEDDLMCMRDSLPGDSYHDPM